MTAIAACPANAVTIAISRSSNGLTSLRHTFSAPTTSSSSSIGAPMVVRKPADPLEVEAAVVRIGQHVRDLLGPAVESDPADEGVPVHRHRVLGDEPDGLLADTRPT